MLTKFVVAICVLESVDAGVGAVGLKAKLLFPVQLLLLVNRVVPAFKVV